MDVDHLAQLTGLDRDAVTQVCLSLGNDRDAVERALDQFYDSSGPFAGKESSSEWVHRKKNNAKKGDDDQGIKNDDGNSKGGGRAKGEGKGSSKGEGRGRGGKGDGNARGRGRGRETPPVGERLPRESAPPPKAPPAEVLIPNGSAPHWEPPAEQSLAKTFVSAKLPATNAWGQNKDWSSHLAATAPEPASEPKLGGLASQALAVEPELQLVIDATAVAPSSRERNNGRGKGGSRDSRYKNRDAETFGDSAQASRGRGRGSGRRDSRPTADPAAAESETAAIPLETTSVEMSADTPLVPIDLDLPINSSELPPSNQELAQSGLSADPAILKVGKGSPSDNVADLSVLSKVPLFGESKLPLGGFESVPAAAPQAKPFLGNFEMPTNDVSTPSLESICGSSCGYSNESPLQLPVPGSLSNALPASGGTALPGFCAGNDSITIDTPEQQLSESLQHLQMGGDLTNVRPVKSCSETSSRATSLPGILPPSGLTAPKAAIGSTLSSTLPVQGLAPDGIGSMPPTPLPSVQGLSHEPPRSNTSRGRTAQMASAAPPGISVPAPPQSGIVLSAAGGGISLEPIGCPVPCPVSEIHSHPPVTLIHTSMPPMQYDVVAQMGPLMNTPPSGYDLPHMGVPVAPPNMGGRNSDKEGRSRNNRNNKKKNGLGQCRDGGCFSGPLLGPDSMNAGIMPPPGLISASSTGSMAIRCAEMPSSTGQGPPGMMQPQQFAPPQQQFYVTSAMPAMPNCFSYGGPAGLSSMCAYAAPSAGMGAGMYQPPAACANLYQAPPQYTQQQPQQYVPQPPQYVPQPQQPFGMPQQAGGGGGGYAYQSSQGLAMGGGMGGMGGNGMGGGGGGMGGGGMGGSMGGGMGGVMGGGMGGGQFNAHNVASYGYDDSDGYNSQPPSMFGGGPPGGYYRPS